MSRRALLSGEGNSRRVSHTIAVAAQAAQLESAIMESAIGRFEKNSYRAGTHRQFGNLQVSGRNGFAQVCAAGKLPCEAGSSCQGVSPA